MRLATYRAASLADQGKDFARETAIARQLCAAQGHADRLRRRPAARRPRLRQGVPGRALVPRPARRRRDGGRRCSYEINLEVPKKFEPLVEQAHTVADRGAAADLAQVRPRRARVPEGARHARRADRRRSTRAAARAAPGAAGVSQAEPNGDGGNRNGSNMASVLSIIEMCWGDVGLLLTMPRQGLGNSAIAAVADEEQKERFAGKWAAMAITEPEAGSDSAAIRTTAVLDGDEYVLNGEKIYVTSGERAELVVVWASLDREPGPRRDQVLRRRALQPGPEARPPRAQARHPRLRHRRLHPRRLPRAQGGPARQPRDRHEEGLRRRHADVRQHAPARRRDGDRRRPRLPRAHPRAARRGRGRGRLRPARELPARRRRRAARARGRLRGRAPADAWRRRGWPTTRKPNSLHASYAKAKAGRTCVDIALRCVALCGSAGLGEDELLEKWARDAKILDIFEGTQQIQLLIIARQLLGLTSAELK